MKLYEFLQKIEDCGQEFAINLCSHNREGFLSRLERLAFTLKTINF